MFAYMDQALTIKESFDLASAEYPIIAAVLVFNGDMNLKIRELENRAPKEPYYPSPTDNIEDRDIEVDLSWSGGDIDWWDVGPAEDDTLYYDVYLGTNSNSLVKLDTIGPLPADQKDMSFDPGILEYNTQHYWKIVARDSHDVEVSSPVWSFKTISQSVDPIDQQCTQWDRLNGLSGWAQAAQSFKPSTEILTKISLFLSKSGTPLHDLEIIICDDSSGEPDAHNKIVSTFISKEYIDRDPSWVEIDFTDTAVTVGETYYILLRTDGDLNTLNSYKWANIIEDRYNRGNHWQRIKNYETNEYVWQSVTIKDDAFKTYSSGGATYFTLSTNKQGSGSVSPPGGSYVEDAVVDLVATPSFGWIFSQWLGNDIDGSTNPSESIIMNDDKSVTAVFTQNSQNNPPFTPNTPSPSDNSDDQNVNVDLSWAGGDPDSGDTVTYDIYFGTNNNPPKVKSGHISTVYDYGTLEENTEYFWKIIAKDNHDETTTGDLWSFTTTEGQHGISIQIKQFNMKKINVDVKNLESNPISNIDWNIKVNGGVLGLVNLSSDGIISNIDAGSTVEIKSEEFKFGLGLVDIIIECNINGETFKEEKDGFIIGTAILIF